MSETTAPTTEQQPVPPAADPQASSQVAEVAAKQGFKVFAGNLTYATDEAALKTFFAAYSSDIHSAQITFHGPRSAGYGFVTFNTEETANKAITELDKKELDGRPVIVERAKPLDQKAAERAERKPKRKFGGRRGSKAVPGEATETRIDAEGAPAVNGVEGAAEGGEAARPKKKKAPRKKKAKKTDENADPAAAGTEAATGDAVDAVATTGEKTERAKKPRKPKAPRRAKGETPAGEPSKSVLFVANLAFTVDEEALTEFFTGNGVTVKSARVVRWRWGTPRKSKGYAFVDVGDEAEQQKALEAVQGKTIAEREVTVKIAVNSKKVEEEAEGGEAGAATDERAPAIVPVA